MSLQFKQREEPGVESCLVQSGDGVKRIKISERMLSSRVLIFHFLRLLSLNQ